MSNTVPKLPAPAAAPPPKAAEQAQAHTQTLEHSPASEHRSASAHAAQTALSSNDIAYVKSLMGVIPAQKLEIIMLRTGIPLPVNLGRNADTSA